MTLATAREKVESCPSQNGVGPLRFLEGDTAEHAWGWVLYFEQDARPADVGHLGGGVWLHAYVVDRVTGVVASSQVSAIALHLAIEGLKEHRTALGIAWE